MPFQLFQALCIYDKKSNTTNKPAEDVREFNGDDPYDNWQEELKNAGIPDEVIERVGYRFKKEENDDE